jgi:hypothetical protein
LGSIIWSISLLSQTFIHHSALNVRLNWEEPEFISNRTLLMNNSAHTEKNLHRPPTRILLMTDASRIRTQRELHHGKIHLMTSPSAKRTKTPLFSIQNKTSTIQVNHHVRKDGTTFKQPNSSKKELEFLIKKVKRTRILPANSALIIKKLSNTSGLKGTHSTTN